jgi:hypothetical protein
MADAGAMPTTPPASPDAGASTPAKKDAAPATTSPPDEPEPDPTPTTAKHPSGGCSVAARPGSALPIVLLLALYGLRRRARR